MDLSDATSKGMSQDGRTRQEAAVPPQQVRATLQQAMPGTGSKARTWWKQRPQPQHQGGFSWTQFVTSIPWGGRAGCAAVFPALKGAPMGLHPTRCNPAHGTQNTPTSS